jgi:hypothetical protein
MVRMVAYTGGNMNGDFNIIVAHYTDWYLTIQQTMA